MNLRGTHLIWLVIAVAAAAFAAPLAQAGNDPSGSVGLAKAILQSQDGFSPARAEAWTTGVCSYQVKPSSCYLTPAQSHAQSIAQAQSMLPLTGISSQQRQAWTQGVCSYTVKPSSCYLTPAEQRAQSNAEAVALGAPTAVSSPTSTTSGGFDWGDAGIGAAAMLGIVLIGIGVAFTLVTRGGRRQSGQPRHA